MAKKKIVFIINPISGTGKQYGIEKKIKQYLDHKKFKSRIYYSEYAGHLTKKTQKAISKEFDYIVSVGGDGSINEVFQNLVGYDNVMGILPTGSGNGLARHLNIPLNLKKAIQLFNSHSILKIDTAEINQHPFVSIAGVGYDAFVAKLFDEAKNRGFWSYFKIVLSSYFHYKEKEYRISINDGETKSIKAFMVCFANSNQFGNNVQIAPQANINDGFIDVCIVKKIPIWAIPFTTFLLVTKKLEKSRYYRAFKAEKLKLHSTENLQVNIDGDPKQLGDTIELIVRPSSLNIVSPKI